MSRESKATKDEIQRNRDEAYQNGWGDGYAEGYGKATEDAIATLPAAPAEDVRAGALKEAAAYHESMAADEDALSARYRGGSNPWFAHVQAAKWHREHAAAILALIPEAKP